MPPPLLRPDLEEVTNLPNLISIAGYGFAIVWLAGGSWPWAALSILCDEVDGSVARALGEESEFGAALDHTIDITLTGAVAMKMGPPGLMVLPIITMVQATTKEDKVTFGSWRALLMTIDVLLGVGP